MKKAKSQPRNRPYESATMSRFEKSRPHLTRAVSLARKSLLIVALASPLAACGPDRVVTGSIPDHDYRTRHPIVLGEQRVNLDVFVAGASHKLDARSYAQVREFGQAFNNNGNGTISVLVPANGPAAAASSHAVAQIRKALVEGGARGHINVGNYPVGDATLASPVRLSYEGLKARTRNACGQWPTDLASGSTIEGWENRQYWNFGCSSQNALAQQIADPRDLVNPRAETPADTEMRMRGIQNVRKGDDPGTKWTVKNTSIGSTGSN